MTEPDEAANGREQILDPSLEIIDAHHHFYERGEHEEIYYDQFLIPELERAVATGHNVVGSVFVECSWRWDQSRGALRAPTSEVEEAARAAREMVEAGALRGMGIVAYVDLSAGEAVGAVLDEMIEVSENRIVGIRHGTAWDDDARPPGGSDSGREDLMNDPVWRRGFYEVARRGLAFDALVFYPQLGAAANLARAFPEATIIVDHLGGPITFGRYGHRKDQTVREWLSNVAQLAREPNVFLKLGGIGNSFMSRIDAGGIVAMDSVGIDRMWGSDMRKCIDLFGTERCLFESNYPVDKAVAEYQTLWNGFKRIVTGASADEKHDLFSGTARRAYELNF
jgi:L-fuconolactonase